MQLLVFVSLLIVGFASADLVKDITELGEKSYVLPCFTALNCQYKDKPEFKPAQKCLDDATPEDVKNTIKSLNSKENLLAKYKNLKGVFTGYYCSLNKSQQTDAFRKLVGGVLPAFDAKCQPKNGVENCQHNQELFGCVLYATNELFRAGKCGK